MYFKEQIGILKDQLIYNIHYAPKYPVEDRTNLEKEEKHMLNQMNSIIEMASLETKKKKIVSARGVVLSGFQMYKDGKNDSGRMYFEAALQILSDLLKSKNTRVRYIVGSDGVITPK